MSSSACVVPVAQVIAVSQAMLSLRSFDGAQQAKGQGCQGAEVLRLAGNRFLALPFQALRRCRVQITLIIHAC